MTYKIKEIFYTLQGEGANAGRAAVFVRFSGCNLWSGREKDRANATCKFCDTDFVGGKKYDAAGVAAACAALWPPADDNRFVVLTGGEPALQVDGKLVSALKRDGFQVAIETNGTVEMPAMHIDWVCVSPKEDTVLRVTVAEEVKLVFPQKNLMPDKLRPVQAFHRWLSPMDGPMIRENIAAAIDYCKAHPDWKLTMQAHKIWKIR